jgi:hypothetical protein
MAIDHRFGSKTEDFADRERSRGTRLDSGPFIGVIKNNFDPARLGRVQVYIPELGGLDQDDSKNWRTVSYSSPYLGHTNASVSGNTSNEYGATKESYGFWMTPPDVGIQVICIFASGDPNRGYYIGCIPDAAANHMVPAMAGSPKTKVSSLTPEQLRQSNGAQFLPVVEFNQSELDKMTNPDIYANVEKPVHNAQFLNFARQGLLSDRTRGVISSSSQRESPSAVFGFSTPGRVIAANDNNPSEVWMRQGGHSVVLDDGDNDGFDNLLRLRTSAGHQIMMNDTAGVIHIIAANGGNWIELGADGSIRAYATADISVRAESNINITSGSTITLDASKINLLSKSDINLQASGSINFKAGANLTVFAGGTVGIKGSVANICATSAAMTCTGELNLVGNLLKLNSGPMAAVAEPGSVQQASIQPDAEPWDNRPNGTAEASPTASGLTPPAAPDNSPRVVPTSSGPAAVVDNATTRPKTLGKDFATILLTQPPPPGGIGILTAEEVRTLFANIAASESGGVYSAENTIGYSGKYQFGVAALEDAGMVKRGSWALYKRNLALRRPEIWTGRLGINNQKDWFNSPAAQEKVMYENAVAKHRLMLSNGGILKGDSPQQVAGMIKVAHLLGGTGAQQWRAGKGGADAYGTTGNKYYDQGYASLSKVPPAPVKTAASPPPLIVSTLSKG